VRARQNPAYLHPQAHFFEASTWTGSANPLWNWLWFVSGARWRGHCSTSLGEVVFKARDLGSTILSEYSAVVTAVVVAGAAFLLWRTRTALRTISLIWIVLSEIAYYLLYQPSGSGMILPLFFCLSLLAGVGVAAVWYLAAAMSPRRLRSRVLSLSLAAIVAAGSVCAIIPRQRLDYSTQRGPATLVSEMIDKLPRGSVVEGIEWKYEKIVDYFRIVEARDIPFRQGTCDAATIADGRCFILGTQLKAQYLRQGCPLSLYLYVENALPVYRLQKPEDRVP
jgi:hypothetical protein